MNIISNTTTKIKHLALALAAATLLVACSEEDPFVDRTVAPVLIVFDGITDYLAAGGLTTVPSVTKNITAANYADPVVLSIRVYTLDKTGILDHTVGIDSIPVSNLRITFSKRDGSVPMESITDTEGKITITTTWQALGIANADALAIATASDAKSITVPLLWKGSHAGQSFVRYSEVVFSKKKT
jgi:polyisoprenoid-binding protein YceI